MERGTNISQRKIIYRTRDEGDFPDELVLKLKKEWDLKYGENPGQHGSIYSIDEINGNSIKIAQLTNLQSVRSDSKGKGGLSLTNTMDICRAMDNLKYFNEPTAVIMKHNIVAGFATQTSKQTLDELFRLARDSDRRSNFGGTAVFNRALDKITAEALFELYNPKNPNHFFVDVLAAPEYEENVLSYIKKKSENIRIGKFSRLDVLPKFIGDETYGLLSIKEMPGGIIGVQDIYLTGIKGPDNLITDPMVIEKDGTKHIIERDPAPKEAKDLIAAWYINIAGARSNGVVLIRNGILVAMGSGQVERVGAVEQAIIKGMQKAMDREGIKYDPLMGIKDYEQLFENPFKGAACSSDAFFPFDDSLERLNSVGVTAVIQPYGSINDDVVIDAANKYKMAMPAADKRCFGHF